MGQQERISSIKHLFIEFLKAISRCLAKAYLHQICLFYHLQSSIFLNLDAHPHLFFYFKLLSIIHFFFLNLIIIGIFLNALTYFNSYDHESNKQHNCKIYIQIYLAIHNNHMVLAFICPYFLLLFYHISSNDSLCNFLCIDDHSTIQFCIFCKQIFLAFHN